MPRVCQPDRDPASGILRSIAFARLSTRPRQRSGGTYIIVLGSALIVSVLGLFTITQQRLQRRELAGSAAGDQARLLAKAAVRGAMIQIENNPNWRAYYAQESNLASVEVAAGTMLLEIFDPYDDDLTDDTQDPVILTGVGIAGGSEQRFEQRLQAHLDVLGSLRSSITCGDTIATFGATIRCDNVINCPTFLNFFNSHIYADVEAILPLAVGGTYHGTTTVITSEQLRPLPDPDTTPSYYASLGQAINIGSLPNYGANLIVNSGIESGQGDGQPADDWYAAPVPPELATCEVEQTAATAKSGSYSLLVKNRAAFSAGPMQNTDWVKENTQYRIEAWVYPTNDRQYRFSWYTKGQLSAGTWITSAATDCPKDVWTKLTATLQTPNWSGSLETAYLKLENPIGSDSKDFYIDDVAVYELEAARYLSHQLLSPNHNPFGPADAEGIYTIDCQNQKLIIESSRILGTLILKNPGDDSQVRGSIQWRPAVLGYPALIVWADAPQDGDFHLQFTQEALQEQALNLNLNPPGAPYGALGFDSDQDDIYPSEIRGVVYLTGDLRFSSNPVVKGSLLVGGDLSSAASGSELRVYYDATPVHYLPPQFVLPIRMLPVVDGAKKAVQ